MAFRAQFGLHFEEGILVDDPIDHLVHAVRGGGIERDDRVERLVHAAEGHRRAARKGGFSTLLEGR